MKLIASSLKQLFLIILLSLLTQIQTNAGNVTKHGEQSKLKNKN